MSRLVPWLLPSLIVCALAGLVFTVAARLATPADAAPAPAACAKPIAFYESVDSTYYELRCSRHAVPHIVVWPDSVTE